MASTDVQAVGPLTTADDLNQAARLYRTVFGYDDPSHAVNPRLLRSLQANGGSVVGAHTADGELVAFAYGFVGVDGEQIYHYSQAAVVDTRYQGRGLGRALKRAQREIALAGGQSHMRWSYDPVLVRNGYFNLDVLGAVGRWFRRDFFGAPGSDRIIVDWDLDHERRPGPDFETSGPLDPGALVEPESWFRAHEAGTDVWLPVPADLGAAARLLGRTDLELRADLANSMARLMDQGHVAVSCRRLSARCAAYRFVPSDVEEG